LYRSSNIVMVIKSWRMRWACHIARMAEVRSAFKILTGTPAGKISLGRPRRSWEDIIRMNIKQIGTRIGPVFHRAMGYGQKGFKLVLRYNSSCPGS
jgi:hypothetical protein